MTAADSPWPALLAAAFSRAVEVAQPRRCLAGALPSPPGGRTLVVGAGKAAASMAAAFEALWPGQASGLVLTRHGHGVPTTRIEVAEAGHPVPDAAGLGATARLLALLGTATPDDLVVGLFSGGGSALLCAPAGGMTLADDRAVNRALLASGAPIDAMNTLRKHLSRVKGGRLPGFAPGVAFTALVMSDVPGDDLSTVASGPTAPDVTTVADARAVIARWNLSLPPTALAALDRPEAETPKPGDPALARVVNRLVMTPALALRGAREVLERGGARVEFLGDAIEGEAAALGRAHARLALVRGRGAGPLCILSGGETTVRVTGRGGRGGRNSEYLLALALALDGTPGVHALAADTDGIDGSQDNAGARLGPGTLARARAAGIDPAAALEAHDAYAVFEAAGDLIVTGPTHTNVNDFRAILLAPVSA